MLLFHASDLQKTFLTETFTPIQISHSTDYKNKSKKEG